MNYTKAKVAASANSPGFSNPFLKIESLGSYLASYQRIFIHDLRNRAFLWPFFGGFTGL
jgi:hypothetical protein